MTRHSWLLFVVACGLSSVAAAQHLPRVTLESDSALFDFVNDELWVIDGKILARHAVDDGAVIANVALPCAPRAIEGDVLLCDDKVLKLGAGAVLDREFPIGGRALAARPGLAAVASDKGVTLLDLTSGETRAAPFHSDATFVAIAFGPRGARLYAASRASIFVAKVSNESPDVPRTKTYRYDGHLAHLATIGNEDPRIARFGGQILRSTIPTPSLAAAAAIVFGEGVRAVAVQRDRLALQTRRGLVIMTPRGIVEELPPPPEEIAEIEVFPIITITAGMLLLGATPAIAALDVGGDPLALLAITGVAGLGAGAALYGGIGLFTGAVLLYESAQPYKPIRGPGRFLNQCGRACWETVQIFLCLGGATIFAVGAALVVASPFAWTLYEPAAGRPGGDVDLRALGAAGAAAATGLTVYGLTALIDEDLDDDEFTNAVPRLFLSLTAGMAAGTAVMALTAPAN